MVLEDWSEVPADLLWNIIERLPVVDYIRFGAVCVSWCAALAEKRHPPLPQFPWLLLPDVRDNGTRSPIRTFCLTDDKEYHMDIPHDFYGFTCIGSSEGWLLFLDLSTPGSQIYLFNPISRARLTLPSVATLPTSNLDRPGFLNPLRFIKVVLSPYRSSGFMAFATRHSSGSLAFAKEGDTAWTIITMNTGLHEFSDIIFYNGQLWGLTNTGWVVACDLSDISDPRVTLMVRGSDLELKDPKRTRYLVECDGDLLVVWRGMREVTKGSIGQVWRGPTEKIDGRMETTTIKIFKMDHTKKEIQWIELKSLGDHILFLGSNPSLAFSSQYFPELRNRVYLTNLLRIGDFRSDLLIYHMEDKLIEPLLSLCKSESKRPLMFWFTPKFPYAKERLALV